MRNLHGRYCRIAFNLICGRIRGCGSSLYFPVRHFLTFTSGVILCSYACWGCRRYLAIFALGIMPTSWSYTAEIEPLRVRNKAQAVGVFWHWMANCE